MRSCIRDCLQFQKEMSDEVQTIYARPSNNIVRVFSISSHQFKGDENIVFVLNGGDEYEAIWCKENKCFTSKDALPLVGTVEFKIKGER